MDTSILFTNITSLFYFILLKIFFLYNNYNSCHNIVITLNFALYFNYIKISNNNFILFNLLLNIFINFLFKYIIMHFLYIK